MTDEQDLRERLEHLELDGNQVANVLAIIAQAIADATAEQGRQLEAICGALADAGTVLAARQDGDYAASVRELTRQRDWAGLLARALSKDLMRIADVRLQIWDEGRDDWSEYDCEFRNGLPVEREDIRAALEAALDT
jgi:hypothetical protein